MTYLVWGDELSSIEANEPSHELAKVVKLISRDARIRKIVSIYNVKKQKDRKLISEDLNDTTKASLIIIIISTFLNRVKGFIFSGTQNPVS